MHHQPTLRVSREYSGVVHLYRPQGHAHGMTPVRPEQPGSLSLAKKTVVRQVDVDFSVDVAHGNDLAVPGHVQAGDGVAELGELFAQLTWGGRGVDVIARMKAVLAHGDFLKDATLEATIDDIARQAHGLHLFHGHRLLKRHRLRVNRRHDAQPTAPCRRSNQFIIAVQDSATKSVPENNFKMLLIIPKRNIDYSILDLRSDWPVLFFWKSSQQQQK